MSLTEQVSSQWARRLLVAFHLPIIALPTVFTLAGVSGVDTIYPAALSVLAISPAILALQLRHSLAAANDTRPPGWPWTYAALALLVNLPLLWLDGTRWGGTQVMLIASTLMLIRGRRRYLVFPWFGAVETMIAIQRRPLGTTPAQVVFDVLGAGPWFAAIGVALYAAARMVRVLDELHATRAELAQVAVDQERLRVSRDLHDLLGHSLSAISLKGDLAAQLLRDDPPAARAEIESLTKVARDALRGVRAVTRDEHAISLAAETHGAAMLLTAAGIRADIAVDLPDLPAATEQMLAWALREGVTNVLRHSEAATCAITASAARGALRLEIVNDRAHPPSESGTGLTGLAQRARDLSGSVTAGHTGDGGFRLLVELML